MSYLTIPLDASFKKNEFSCGKVSLDDYLHKQVSQDIKRKLAVCFVIAESKTIKGYYTLSNHSIPQEQVPEEIRKKLPKSYTNIPTTLLGRLAVDEKHKGQKIGETLLLDALKRSLDVSKNSIASMAIIVDPIDNEAVAFYKKYGFIQLPDSGKMFMPMKAVEGLFG
ncbi:MAG: GNAT family N-acetyltransferase [Bacteroidota bacterium]|nr:GNAT family N-acetyltransferase [Bacteroidota bacterium]